MDEFLSRDDSLELIIYYGGSLWLFIALIMAYFKTNKGIWKFKNTKVFRFYI